MEKSHRSLCAAALCVWSPLLAAQSFSDTRPKVSSAVHPWAKQEVIEDVSLANAIRQGEKTGAVRRDVVMKALTRRK